MNERTNEHIVCIFRVTAVVRMDAEVMGSKKMSDIWKFEGISSSP
jgi:hypothetical protein